MAEPLNTKSKNGAPIVKNGHTGNKQLGRDEKVQGVIPKPYDQS